MNMSMSACTHHMYDGVNGACAISCLTSCHLLSSQDILGTQLIRRNDELALLYEKIRIQQSTLNKGEMQYRERLLDIRRYKLDINNVKRQLQVRDEGAAAQAVSCD